jgi:Tol biopolymer transport system component
MTREQIDEWVSVNFPEQDILIADGLEEAFIGVAYQFNTPIAVFDKDKCIEILTRVMSLEDAEEYFEFNVQGAYVGENTPAFITLFKNENS